MGELIYLFPDQEPSDADRRERIGKRLAELAVLLTERIQEREDLDIAIALFQSERIRLERVLAADEPDDSAS